MRIMYLISRQFNILMNVKAMTNKGFGNKDIASKADVGVGGAQISGAVQGIFAG